MSKTLCSRRRRLYAAFCRGAPFKAEILRRGWTSCAVAPREGMERGHYVDIEVVAAAVCRVRGPVPTFEELDAVADLLRRPGNHRSVTHSENVGVERAAAAAVIRGHAGALLAQ